MKMFAAARPHHQQGIALATALIFMVVITLLGLIAVRTSTIELRLALNEQVRVEALQTAQSVVDAVIANPANLPISSNEDFLACLESGSGLQTTCNNAILSLGPTTNPITPASGSGADCDPNAPLFQTGIYAEVRRLPPENTPVPGVLLTSMDKFTTAAFAVRGQYACGNSGLGTADIEEGILRLVPTPGRIN